MARGLEGREAVVPGRSNGTGGGGGGGGSRVDGGRGEMSDAFLGGEGEKGRRGRE